MYLVDARGEACPKPVLMTKSAVQNGEESIQTLVDNTTAVENITRFAASVGYTCQCEQRGEEYCLTLEKSAALSATAVAADQGSWAVFCTEKQIGMAQNELGGNLIKMYFYTLTQMANPPSVVAFLNEGVLLPCQEEQIVESLQTLIAQGTRVMVCGACLNFYQLTEKLRCGSVSNMYEILEAVSACGKMMKI